MRKAARSDCPISHALEALGDRWSLLVLRDVMFADKRSYNHLLASDEGIATNILRDRLKGLVAQGLLRSEPDPAHSQKVIYSLTEKSVQLLPTILHLGMWGQQWLSPGPDQLEPIRKLFRAGPKGWEKQMQRLREIHRIEPPTQPPK